MIDLSVVIPAYNEEIPIVRAIKETTKSLKKSNIKSEIIVVNDGSTDKTRQVCERLMKDFNFKLINHRRNKGYAEAIRTGLKHARGDYFCFLDADLQFRPEHMIDMFNHAVENDYYLVIGVPKTKNYNLFKKFRSFMYNHILLKIFFNVQTTDVDSLKVMKKKVLDSITLKSGYWIIDLEIIYRFRKKGHKLHEYPIKVYPREEGESKTTMKSVIRTFFEVLILKWNTLFER